METRQLLRPLGNCSGSLTGNSTARFASVSVSASVPFSAATGRRHQSSTSRTKKMLKIPPHPSFLTPIEGQNHVVYNPPSAAPSVYHTPFKFLPRTDPRRQASLSQMLRSSLEYQAAHPKPPSPPEAQTQTQTQTGQPNPDDIATAADNDNDDIAFLPPEATKLDGQEKRYNVTREQVDEMRRLRAEDPRRWSVLKLAERYDCNPVFIMMCCRASREHRDKERERLEAIKARWGPIRAGARDERQKRRKLLHRGGL
ncbi:mitochondrial ribosomal protein subunit L20-domain-containing protein [Biscogniauxia marginata]|nr:mitochondrial ribosomal protein subunit L20-domain-containing protein [Biscogniauxia marginata]